MPPYRIPFVPCVTVKKAISIFLLSIYLLTFAEFHQFLRIPALVEHFIEHRHLTPSISFMDFLRIHYVGPNVVDDDYQRDNQLPFRQADCCLTTITFSCECPASGIEIACQSMEVSHHFILHNDDDKPLLSVTDIFQPPRLA
jgi:hypothetical protein